MALHVHPRILGLGGALLPDVQSAGGPSAAQRAARIIAASLAAFASAAAAMRSAARAAVAAAAAAAAASGGLGRTMRTGMAAWRAANSLVLPMPTHDRRLLRYNASAA